MPNRILTQSSDTKMKTRPTSAWTFMPSRTPGLLVGLLLVSSMLGTTAGLPVPGFPENGRVWRTEVISLDAESSLQQPGMAVGGMERSMPHG